MIDPEDRIDNKVIEMPSQAICARVGCHRVEYWHYDDEWKVRTCQNYLEKSSTPPATGAGLSRSQQLDGLMDLGYA